MGTPSQASASENFARKQTNFQMPERKGGAPKPAKSRIPFSGFAHYNFSGFAFYTTYKLEVVDKIAEESYNFGENVNNENT